MTNRLELNWKLDGFVDEQHYYCAETSIDPLNLPVPKTILAGDIRTYIDTAIEVEKTYYVAIGSVRGGIEKLSDIAIVTTAMSDEYWGYVSSLVRFNGPNNSPVFTDEKGTIWSRNGSPIISTAQSKFGGSSGRFSKNNYISTNTMAPFLFGASEDFTVEAWLYLPTGASIYEQEIPILCIGAQDVSTQGGGWNFCLFDKASATMRLERDSTNFTAQAAEFQIGSATPRDTWMHVEFGRQGGITYGFFNGVLKGTSTIHNNIPFNSPNISNVSIGSGNARLIPNNWHLDAFLDDVRVTKGVCRHTASFAPPDREAPNF